MNFCQKFSKRTFDVVMAFLGLLLLWPLIAACVIWARLDTREPGLFLQTRVGRHGREFKVLKVRTMRSSMMSNTITVSTDPRISQSGQFMRRFKLDELPQLWNVLWGDMSFVGPRPDVPGYADQLQGEDRVILELKPGITGPATIKYRDEERLLASKEDPKRYNDAVIFPDKVRINIAYLRNWTLSGDIKYILMTVGLLEPPEFLESPLDTAGSVS